MKYHRVDSAYFTAPYAVHGKLKNSIVGLLHRTWHLLTLFSYTTHEPTRM